MTTMGCDYAPRHEARASPSRSARRSAGALLRRRSHPAARVFSGERGISLSRSRVRRSAVCAHRAARRGVAADRQRGRRILDLAPAMALLQQAAAGRETQRADARQRARAHEHLLLSVHRSPAARHGGRDRIPGPHRARGARGALQAEFPRARAGGGRRICADRCAARRPAARLRLRLRQLRLVRALHHPRPPYRGRRRHGRNRSPGLRHAGRDGGCLSHRNSPGVAGLRESAAAGRRYRRRHQLFSDPVRDRSARHGAAAAGDVRAYYCPCFPRWRASSARWSCTSYRARSRWAASPWSSAVFCFIVPVSAARTHWSCP